MPFQGRSTSQIQTQIQQSVANNSVLSSLLTSTSLSAIWINLTYIMALATQTLEQIMIAFQVQIESTVNSEVPGTTPWMQKITLAFQYGDELTLNPNYSYSYQVIDASKQIVAQCAFYKSSANPAGWLLKITGVSGPLDGSPGIGGPQCIALQSYLNTITPAGFYYTLVNALADIIQINATIFYNGQYIQNIQSNVITALNAYLLNIPFNQVIKISAIEQAILAVPGVNDVVFSQILCQTNPTTTPTYLVQNGTTVTRTYIPSAGYTIIDPLNPLSGTLTFNASNN